MIEEYRYYPIVPNPNYVEGGNEPQEVWGDIEDNGEYKIEPSTDDCIAMENVVIKVKVPQNARVLNMDNTTNSEEPPFVKDQFESNGQYDISQWNEAHNTNYVGFNPVNVQVPNLIAVPKIFKENTTNPYTIYDWKADPVNSNVERKDKYIGFNNIQVDVPNVTIPVEEPNNPEDTPMNTIVTRRENGKYTINQWKLEHLNDTTTEQRNSVVGLSEIMINVPNKVVTPTNISSNTNGTPISIANWKLNEGANVLDKDDYVGFDNITVNVAPRLLNGVINIPSNNYPLSISNWNNEHPNDLKDGYNDIIIHYNENNGGDSGGGDEPHKELVNAVIQSNNSISQTIMTGVEGILLKERTLSTESYNRAMNTQINGFLQAIQYTFANMPNNQGQAPITITQNILQMIDGRPQFNPNITVQQLVWNSLTPQQQQQLLECVGGNQEALQFEIDNIAIKMIEKSKQPEAERWLVKSDNTNNQIVPLQQEQQRGEPELKRFKGPVRDISGFQIRKYSNKFDYDTFDVNTQNSTDYYGTWSSKCDMQTEMLEYDTFDIDISDNAQVYYDIVENFINDSNKNPEDEVLDNKMYNPLGIRRLYINWPKNSTLVDNANVNVITGRQDNIITSRNSTFVIPQGKTGWNSFSVNVPSDVDNADVDSQNNNIIISRTGTYTIPNGKTGWNSFSVNVPSDVDNFTGYDQNNRYSITQSGDGVITIPSGRTGLGDVYYNVNVQPDNYVGYDQNNRYLITQSGDGVITIPSGKTGLGDVYYTVNIQPPSPPVSTPNIYYTVLFNSGSGNNVYIISGYDFTEELDNIGIDCNNMRSLYCAFYKVNGCATIVERVTDVINSDYATSMSKMFNGCYSLTSIPLFNTSSVTTMSSMFEDCYSLISIPLFNTSNVTNMSKMFKNCYSLTSVPLFGTSNVTNMNEMFYACYSLKTVPLFDTSSVTNMVDMFLSCASLTSVPLFDTSNVTNMTEMFYGCHSLKTVPLFNTSKVTDMTSMFLTCYYLTSVPLFDTSRVTKMNSMFNSCYSLTSVSLFDTSRVTDMSRMFFVCRSLTSVPLFDTLNVTDMTSMFSNCSSLTSVPLFNTSNVKTMTKMFYSCDSLTSIPLFDTSSVTNMTTMFYSCDSLISVPLFNTSKVTDMHETFNGCTSLSNESLNNILKMCTDSLVSASNKKLNSYVKVSSDYNSIIPSLSNYNDFIAAGWSLS